MIRPLDLRLLLAMLLLIALAPRGAASAGPALLDERDGPDVELRVAIEDDEVRLVIISNLALLDELCDVPRELPSALDDIEAPDAMDALFELFKKENQVSIDGAVVQPVAPRLETDFEVDRSKLEYATQFPNYGARAVLRMRLFMRYPVKSPPERVSVDWGIFPPNYALQMPEEETPPIELISRVAGNGLERVVKLDTESPRLIWHRDAEGGRARFAEVPALETQDAPPFPWLPAGGAALALLGALFGPSSLRRGLFGPLTVALVAYTAVTVARGPKVQLPTEDEALAIFEPLHENIYRAFDYTDESDVYDALAQSVEGSLLETLYDDVYRSLVMQEEGGALSRVHEVRHTEMDVEDIRVDAEDGRAGFVLNALWEVDGVVFHSDHAHSRTNEYRARYTVRGTEAGWRIGASEVLEQRRVSAAPLNDLDFGEDNVWTGFGGKEPGEAKAGKELMEEF